MGAANQPLLNNFGYTTVEDGAPLDEPVEEVTPEKEASATVFSSQINLTNTILGAGMLALPHAFSVGGYSLGAFFLLIAGIGGGYGLHLLGVCAHSMGHRNTSYGGVADSTVPSCSGIISAAVAIKCFGVATSYLIVIGDQFPKVMEAQGVNGMASSREFWIILYHLAICTPLACLPKLDMLKFTSSIALCAGAYLITLVILFAYVPELTDTVPCKKDHLPQDVDPCKEDPIAWTGKTNFLSVMSIFIFSYTCHQNIFTIHNELKINTVKNINQVVIRTVATALAVYSGVAVSGYVLFGPAVKGDILTLYPSDQSAAGKAFTGLRVAIAFFVGLSYPLQSHPCRQSLMHLVQLGLGKPPGAIWHWGLTAGILAGSLCIALAVTSLGMVLAVVGATASTTLCYILPGVFYCKRFEADGWTPKWISAAGMFILGCAIVPVCLTAIFIYHASE